MFPCEEEGQRHVNPRETFKVNIAPSVLEQMVPFENTHKRSDRGFGERVVLTPASGWTSILTSLICGQHELPCVFVYKEGRITKDPDLAQYYFATKWHCSDCGAKLEGHILQIPMPNESVTLLFETDDTRTDKTHTKKRHCAGRERNRVTNDMGETSAAVSRRR